MQVEFDGKIINFESSMTVREILKKLNLNPEVYLVVLENNELATSDRLVGKDQKIKIIRVVSGG